MHQLLIDLPLICNVGSSVDRTCGIDMPTETTISAHKAQGKRVFSLFSIIYSKPLSTYDNQAKYLIIVCFIYSTLRQTTKFFFCATENKEKANVTDSFPD